MSPAPRRQEAEDTVGLIEEGGEVVLWEANVPRERSAGGLRRTAKLTALSLGAAALLAVAIGAAGSARRAASPQEADVGSRVELQGLEAMASTFAGTFEKATKLAKDAKTGQSDLQESLSSLTKAAQAVQKDVQEEDPPQNVSEAEKHLLGEALFKKLEDDGNPCPDDEEEHVGLCYGKCSDITKGEYPIRTTAFSCCREKPCSIFNSKFTNLLKVCGGIDVAGKREGGACPHVVGDCLRNEELLFGECYIKCAIVTDNQFTFRVGPQSCCMHQTKLACLDPANTRSDPTYDVGGGVSDPTYNVAFGEAHTPLPDLADVLATTTLPTVAPLPQMPEMPTVAPLPQMPEMPTVAPLPQMQEMPTVAPLPAAPPAKPVPAAIAAPSPALPGCEGQADGAQCSAYAPSDVRCFCSWSGVSCLMACQ